MCNLTALAGVRGHSEDYFKFLNSFTEEKTHLKYTLEVESKRSLQKTVANFKRQPRKWVFTQREGVQLVANVLEINRQATSHTETSPAM